MPHCSPAVFLLISSALQSVGKTGGNGPSWIGGRSEREHKRAGITPYRFILYCNSPFHFTDYGSAKNMNSTHIYQISLSVPSRGALRSVKLPETGSIYNRLHIFALTLTPSVNSLTKPAKPAVSIRNVRFTTRWEDVDEIRAQVVEITIANRLPAKFATSPSASISSKHSIEVIGHGLKTVVPAHIHRLVPADQARVDVLVLNRDGIGNATIFVKDSQGNVVGESHGWPIARLREHWTPDTAVLATHETPTWVSPWANSLHLLKS